MTSSVWAEAAEPNAALDGDRIDHTFLSNALKVGRSCRFPWSRRPAAIARDMIEDVASLSKLPLLRQVGVDKLANEMGIVTRCHIQRRNRKSRPTRCLRTLRLHSPPPAVPLGRRFQRTNAAGSQSPVVDDDCWAGAAYYLRRGAAALQGKPATVFDKASDGAWRLGGSLIHPSGATRAPLYKAGRCLSIDEEHSTRGASGSCARHS